MKSSAQRAVRASVLEQFPRFSTVIDEVLPKRHPVVVAKCHNHVTAVVVNGEPIFFQVRDGPWVPTLRIIHKYPSVMPKMQVDRGAIKHVLRGSNIMCPGLTTPGGRMEEVPTKAIVQITAEGKTRACAVGITTMSTAEIRQNNRGMCIESLHCLNDGLWKTPRFEE